jgi:hypothetical protein
VSYKKITMVSSLPRMLICVCSFQCAFCFIFEERADVCFLYFQAAVIDLGLGNSKRSKGDHLKRILS